VDTPDVIYNTWKDQPKENIAMDWLETDAGKMLHESQSRDPYSISIFHGLI
jgi:hypothetical protein